MRRQCRDCLGLVVTIDKVCRVKTVVRDLYRALTGTEQGERYSFDVNGALVIEQFMP